MSVLTAVLVAIVLVGGCTASPLSPQRSFPDGPDVLERGDLYFNAV